MRAFVLILGLVAAAAALAPNVAAQCGQSVTVSPADILTVNEGVGTATVTLTRTPSSCIEWVGMSIDGGSVSFPNDLSLPNSNNEYTTLYFGGTNAVTFQVTIVDDGEVEEMEYTSLRFELENSHFAGGSSRIAAVELRIEDNDVPGSEQARPEAFLYYTGQAAVLSEGGPSPFLVGSNMDLQGAEVTWEIRIATASWDDFVAAGGVLPLDGTGPWPLDVRAWDDDVGEAWETASVCLTHGTGVEVRPQPCVEVGIYESDGGIAFAQPPSTEPGRLELPAPLGRAWEGSTFVVRLDRGTTQGTASVQWTLEALDGLTIAVTPASGSVAYGGGQLEAEASFVVGQDTATNPGRYLRFCLTSPVSLVVPTACSAIEVLDDEGAASAPPALSGVHVGATAVSAKDLTASEVERARASTASRPTTRVPGLLEPGGLIPGLEVPAMLAALAAAAVALRRQR